MSRFVVRSTRSVVYAIGGLLIGALLGLVLGMIVHSLAVISAGHTVNATLPAGLPWAPRWGAILFGAAGLLIAGYAGLVVPDAPEEEAHEPS